MIDIALFNSGH